MGEDLDAFDLDGMVGGGAYRRGGGFHTGFVELAAELFEFFFVGGDLLPEGFGGRELNAGCELVSELGDGEVAAELFEGSKSGNGFDAADSGRDGAFAEELDGADLAGGGGVGASAELGGEVADLDDAHLVAVLLAEERHGVVLVDGDVDGHVFEGDDGGVREHFLINEVLDVLQFLVGDGGEVGEVEAEAVVVDERSGLLDVFAEDLAESGVEEVSSGVIAAGGVAVVGVDDGVDLVADVDGLAD